MTHLRFPTTQKVLFATGALALAAMSSATAIAGECPAGKAEKGFRTSGVTEGKGVADMELAAVDLSNEVVQLEGRQLRLRKLIVEPGGQVPFHSHAERPALIMTVSGTIKEFRSDCRVPIVHNAGEVSKESGGISHWWRNDSDEPVVLIAADIKPAA